MKSVQFTYRVLLLADSSEGQRKLASWLPIINNMRRKDGRATAYICEDYVCKLPTAESAIAARLLDEAPKP